MSDDYDGPVPSALDFLREQLAARKAAEERRVPLRDMLSRPEIVVTVRVPRDASELAAVQDQAEREESKDNAPPGSTILAAMTLARFAVQVTYNGMELAPGDGAAFSSPQLQEVVGAKRGWLACRALFDDDLAMTRVFQAFQREAGIIAGSSAVQVGEVADPT